MNIINLENRKILITGASSGIGRATAVLASKLGAAVVLCGRNLENLNKTHEMMTPGNHTIIPFDITDFEKYSQIFKQAVSDGIKLNGMVHCAGIADISPLRLMNYNHIKNITDTNFTSFILLVSEYSKKNISAGGSIVGISAANVHYPQKYMSIYAASKAAVEASIRSMAIELTEKQIRINCIVPGAVNTPMAEKTDEAVLNNIVSKQLLGITTPEEIANSVIYLISDISSSTTGRTIFADGGRLGQ